MSWAAVIAGGAALIGGAMSSQGAKDAGEASQRGADASIAEQRRQFDLTRQDTAPYRQTGENALNRLAQLQGFAPFSRTTYGDPNAPPPAGGDGIDPSSGWMIGPGGGVTQGAVVGGGGAPGSAPAGGAAPGAAPGQPDFSSFFTSPDYNFRVNQGSQALERSAAARGGLVSGNTGAALTDFGQQMGSEEYGNFYNRLAALAGIGQSGVNTATSAGMNMANNNSAALQNAGDARASGIAGSTNAWGNALGQIGGIVYDRWGRKQPPRAVGGMTPPYAGWNA